MTQNRLSRCGVLARAWLLAWLLAACEPEATPLPAFAPVETSEVAAITATPAPVRYALSPEAAAFASAVRAANPDAEIVILDEPPQAGAILAHYDIVAGLGAASGWQQSPVMPTISLALATRRPPLDSPAVAEAVRASLDATALAQASGIAGLEPVSVENANLSAVRQSLANAGWPDGFDLTLGYTVTPGLDAVAAALRGIGLNVTLVELAPETVAPALKDGRIDSALFAWTNTAGYDAIAAHSDFVIDLYAVPIRYIAVEELQVSFTEDGWPAAAQSG